MKHELDLTEFLKHNYTELLAISSSITNLHYDHLTEFVHNFIIDRIIKYDLLNRFDHNRLKFISYIWGHIRYYWCETLSNSSHPLNKLEELLEDCDYGSNQNTPLTFVIKDSKRKDHNRLSGIIAMVLQGYTYDYIANEYNITRQRVHSLLKQSNINIWDK